ncbi:MAG: cache domain-containing protein [Acidobacteria bacterium]|nr:cache domain-containing protein [Acidobacteriota bacterium]
MISRLSDISLRAKVTISFVLIVICGTAISTFLGSKIITRSMLNEALKQVRHGLNVAEMVYAARLDNVRKSVTGAAETAQLASALTPGKEGTLPLVLSQLRDKNRLQFLAYVSARDRRIVRALEPSARQPDEIPQPISYFVRQAMSGKVVASTSLLSRDVLMQEDPALAERADIPILADGSQTAAEGDRISQGMVLVAAAPVIAGNRSVGVLYGGILLNRDEELIEQINDFVFGAKQEGKGTAGITTIFLRNVRIATNVRGASGERLAGGHAPADIYRAVSLEGKSFYTRSFVSGSWHLTAGKPIRDHQGQIVGILGVGIPENPFLDVRTSMMMTFLLVAGIGILVVLVITYFITRSMIYPLEEMVKATNRIAAGNLDQKVTITSNDEIGILADSFNKMLASIKTMKLELEEWGRTLEEKVDKRTEELVAVQIQMAQSEKLASIGRLAAGVAHEINNPLAGILTFSMLALEDCDDDHPLKESLEVIVKQTLRCRETVKGLLGFARQSGAAPSITEVNSIVDKTLLLLENQAIFQNIRTVRNFDAELPRVFIDAGELQQVIVNIVINAVDAMEENGSLTIETSQSPQTQEILIRIKDTGKGIPDDALPFIFEPFFTTKKVGKGTGLGLAIVHGIVTRAGGKMEVETSPKGTIFTIRLPMAIEEEEPDEADRQSQNADPGAGKSS